MSLVVGVKSVTPKGEKVMYDYGPKIDMAVFPGLQGGPHNNTIAAMAVAMGQAMTKEFVQYQHQVLANAQSMAKRLQELGYKISTDGTENHLVLVDLRPKNTDGSRVESVLELMHVACNKNTCPGDKSAFKPGGIRLGAPALTSRSLTEADFASVVDFIHAGVQLTLKYQPRAGKTLKEFKEFIATDPEFIKEVGELKAGVEKFSTHFPMPGYTDF